MGESEGGTMASNNKPNESVADEKNECNREAKERESETGYLGPAYANINSCCVFIVANSVGTDAGHSLSLVGC